MPKIVADCPETSGPILILHLAEGEKLETISFDSATIFCQHCYQTHTFVKADLRVDLSTESLPNKDLLLRSR